MLSGNEIYLLFSMHNLDWENFSSISRRVGEYNSSFRSELYRCGDR